MPANGDGISKRKDGRYVVRYTVRTADGSSKRKVIYGRKYKEVERKLAGARGDAAVRPAGRVSLPRSSRRSDP